MKTKTFKISREKAIIICFQPQQHPSRKSQILYRFRTKRGTKTSEPQTWILNHSIVIHHPQNKYNHKKASNQIKDPNHLKAITNNHHPQTKKNQIIIYNP